MAGLLAWAADVVTGNGQQQQRDEEDEAQWRAIRFRLTAEEQEEVRQLEERAASLQQTIQHLRIRIPPPEVSQSLPQLHADSLAVQSALTVELNAHQATHRESQAREASLQNENMSYSNAISNVQQQLQVKSQELFHLNARLEEVGKEESLLKVELDQLSSSLAENEGVSMAEKETTSALTSGDKTSKEGEELQKLRSELDMWEKIVAKHEHEWFNLLQNSTKWPSAAQREKELERRLRILSEQYMTKQVQADAILKERNTLQFQLNQLTDASRQDLLMDTESNTYKGKTRKAVSTASNALEDFLPTESKSLLQTTPESDKPLIMIMKNGLRHASEVVSNVLSFRHSRSRQTSSQLSTSFLLRYLLLLYLLMLHIVPFAVILSAT